MIWKSKFYLTVTLIIYGLKIIGLAPFSQHTNRETTTEKTFSTRAFRYSKIGLAYNLVFLILFQVMTVLTFSIWFSASYPDGIPLVNVMDIVQGIVCGVGVHVVIISWAFRQEDAVRVMNRLLEIERLLSCLEEQPLPYSRMFTVLSIHVIFNASLWTALFSFPFLMNLTSFVVFLEWIFFEVSSFVMYWFIVEYFVIVGHVVRVLERINKNLMKLEGIPYYLSCTPIFNDYRRVLNLSTRSQVALLPLLCRIRTTLSEVSADISDFFSLPMLFCILYFCTVFVNTLYYVIAPILVSSEYLSLIIFTFNVVWVLLSAYPLTLLAINVTNAKNEAKQTGRIAHKLLGTVMKREVEVELERFSLELLHEDFSFTAYGFFTLDCTVLYSVVEVTHILFNIEIITLQILGATTTYLVILLQFMDPEYLDHLTTDN